MRTDVEVWDIRGTDRQQALVRDAIDRTAFPFHRLIPGLRRDVGRDVIPVEWADLSRYGASALGAIVPGGGTHDDHDHHDHDHGHTHDEDAEYDTLEFRHRVLGLAWYSGKVSLDLSLESDPDLAAEVFLSEGAHMVDFFYMDDAMRVAVWNAVHPPEQHIHDAPDITDVIDGTDIDHGHGWFDVATYREFVGEAFMGAFVRAFSDVPVRIPFAHQVDADMPDMVDALVRPPGRWVFGVDGSSVFHDRHGTIDHDHEWETYAAAEADGRRPCRVCKPRKVTA